MFCLYTQRANLFALKKLGVERIIGICAVGSLKETFKPGDIVTTIDGTKLTEDTTLATVISKKKVGDKVSIAYFRDGKTNNISVTLASAPNQ